jgi:hypothetical protein
LLGANIGAVHVGNRIWVPQTMSSPPAPAETPPTHGGDPGTSGSDTTLIR